MYKRYAISIIIIHMIHILFFGKVWDIKKHFSGPREEVTGKKTNQKKPTKNKKQKTHRPTDHCF